MTVANGLLLLVLLLPLPLSFPSFVVTDSASCCRLCVSSSLMVVR